MTCTGNIRAILIGVAAAVSTAAWAGETVTPDNYVESEVDITFTNRQ